MLKLYEVTRYWGVDHLFDSELNSVKYHRLLNNGDIQIWMTYCKDPQKTMYELVDVACGDSRVYSRLSDAMAMGILYYMEKQPRYATMGGLQTQDDKQKEEV